VSDDTEVIFRDFTKKRKPVVFGIDGVMYRCIKALGTESLQDLMRTYRSGELQEALKTSDADRIMEFMRAMFKIFLLDESYEPFVLKLRDKEDPVDIHQLLEIVRWVVEVYTNRPSEPSEISSTGSLDGDAGTSSEAGARLAELLPLNEIPVNSSI
jgi:hypothetical protein